MEVIRTFANIREGDTVRRQLAKPPEQVLKTDTTGVLTRLTLSPSPGVTEVYEGRNQWPIILVCRPWPAGNTEAQVLEEVEACARRLTDAFSDARAVSTGQVGIMHDHLEDPQDVLVDLRRAIDAYELGKPARAEVLGVSSDPVEAAIDASSGYLGGGPVGC